MGQVAITTGTRPAFGARLMPRRRTAVEPAATPETADPRTTLAHVRVLEAALEEQVRRVGELTEQLEIERARPHEDVQRMAATVEGLRIAFGKDPVAQRLLARIDAALLRLVDPGELVRVPLPEPIQERVTTGVPTGRAPSGPADAPSEEEPQAGRGTGAETTSSTGGDASGRPKVLPVPPEPTPDEPARRRRLRR